MVDKYYPSSLVPKQHIMLISTRITADLMKADKILCNLHLRQSSFCYFDWTRAINQVFGGGFSEGGGVRGLEKYCKQTLCNSVMDWTVLLYYFVYLRGFYRSPLLCQK